MSTPLKLKRRIKLRLLDTEGHLVSVEIERDDWDVEPTIQQVKRIFGAALVGYRMADAEGWIKNREGIDS